MTDQDISAQNERRQMRSKLEDKEALEKQLWKVLMEPVSTELIKFVEGKHGFPPANMKNLNETISMLEQTLADYKRAKEIIESTIAYMKGEDIPF